MKLVKVLGEERNKNKVGKRWSIKEGNGMCGVWRGEKWVLCGRKKGISYRKRENSEGGDK